MDLFTFSVSILAFGLILVLLLPIFIPITFVETYSKIIQNLSLAIGALIGSYAGSSFLIEEFNRRRLISKYRKMYPRSEYGTEWKQIVREDRVGEPHILDLEKKVKHHIWNMKTIYDLGWQFYDREKVEKGQFDSYEIGDFIRTRGDLGE